MALSSLLYASTAKPGITKDEIEDIVATAREHNGRNAISGILAFDGTGFAQILEGNGPDITALYERIKLDHRHSGCVLLSFTQIGERRFTGWTMAYRQLSDLIMIQEADA